MADNQDLLQRIGHLAGRINLHKTESPARSSPSPELNHQHSLSARPSQSQLWTGPQTPLLGNLNRIRKSSYIRPHHNRTIVLHHNSNSCMGTTNVEGSAGARSDSVIDCNSTAKSGWVSKRGRHFQIINASVFEAETKLRLRAAVAACPKSALENSDLNQATLLDDAISPKTTKSTPPSYRPFSELFVDDIRFGIVDGEKCSGCLVPESIPLGDASYFKDTNRIVGRTELNSSRRKNILKKSGPCRNFTTTGRCIKGPDCYFMHDPGCVAICPHYLLNGKCAYDDDCDLSHDPTAERVPTCLHFLRGNCTNASCRYGHVRVNPSALVCRDFSVLRYCSKGAHCSERHVNECADWSNNGLCTNKKCRLPHVDRAGQIRRQAAGPITASSIPEGEGDLTDINAIYEGVSSDDVDSDDLNKGTVLGKFSKETRSALEGENFVQL